ncbi:MAG: hypothetical protein ACPGVT_12275 [Maricaulaceae bacterium]
MKFTFPHTELPALDVADHIRRKRKADMEALIDGYLPLALNIALDKNGGELSREGVQCAIGGLLCAAANVPPVTAYKFGTYVAWYVRQALNAQNTAAPDKDAKPYWDFAIVETATLLAEGGFDLSKL